MRTTMQIADRGLSPVIAATKELWHQYHLTYDLTGHVAKEVRRALSIERPNTRPRIKGRNSRPPTRSWRTRSSALASWQHGMGEAPETLRSSQARGTGTVLGKLSLKFDGYTSMIAQGLTVTSISSPQTSP